MKVIDSVSALRDFLLPFKNSGKSIGFVPTMGALHRGHMYLIRQSIAENDLTVCSVFVNPTQFNDSSDFEKYPRTPEADCDMLEREGCSVVFMPSEKEVYPDGPPREPDPDFGALTNNYEGKFRPGHFAGAIQIVRWLLANVEPDRAYFGEKDFQQLAVVRRMVREEGLPVAIKGVPIVRAATGLAESSRNQRLTVDGLKKSSEIYKAMQAAGALATSKNPKDVENEGIRMLEQQGIEVEYFALVDAHSLMEIQTWDDADDVRLLVTAYVEGVRLLDNMEVKTKFGTKALAQADN